MVQYAVSTLEDYMKVLKFKIHEGYFEQFKEICIAEEVNVKKKLFLLLSEDYETNEIASYFPEDHHEHLRNMTLKVNEELYKGVSRKCSRLDLSVRDYLPYLIYKCLKEHNGN